MILWIRNEVYSNTTQRRNEWRIKRHTFPKTLRTRTWFLNPDLLLWIQWINRQLISKNRRDITEILGFKIPVQAPHANHNQKHQLSLKASPHQMSHPHPSLYGAPSDQNVYVILCKIIKHSSCDMQVIWMIHASASACWHGRQI